MKRTVGVVLTLWFVAALLAVAGGLLVRVPVPPPLLVAGLAAAVIAAGLLGAGMRNWVLTADLRYLLAPHLVRFVGLAFLYLVSRGVLARAFLPIGWGDAIAAVGAAALLIAGPSLFERSGWWTLLVWNIFGFLDMLLLIATGIRLGLAAPGQFALFRQLPFGLLPTFFVPLIIATHVFIFIRLHSTRATTR
jgi:hypothetical protein